MGWSYEAWRVIDGLWLVMCIVWSAGVLLTKRTARRQSTSSRLWQAGIVGLGYWMLFAGSVHVKWLDVQLYEPGSGALLAGVALTATGIAFAVWARLTLGGNWSGMVTLKEGHTLIQRGPYRMVRHPIYTGLLIATAGTAAASGSLHSLVAIPMVFFGFWLKMVTEENLMMQTFGVEYIEYMRRVKAVVPYVF